MKRTSVIQASYISETNELFCFHMIAELSSNILNSGRIKIFDVLLEIIIVSLETWVKTDEGKAFVQPIWESGNKFTVRELVNCYQNPELQNILANAGVKNLWVSYSLTQCSYQGEMPEVNLNGEIFSIPLLELIERDDVIG